MKCVACFLCATACPAHCIDILADESPWPDREKYPESFTIDELRSPVGAGLSQGLGPLFLGKVDVLRSLYLGGSRGYLVHE